MTPSFNSFEYNKETQTSELNPIDISNLNDLLEPMRLLLNSWIVQNFDSSFSLTLPEEYLDLDCRERHVLDCFFREKTNELSKLTVYIDDCPIFPREGQSLSNIFNSHYRLCKKVEREGYPPFMVPINFPLMNLRNIINSRTESMSF
jgi:hypothetical protein